MGGSEKLCLKWNDFQANYCEALRELRGDEEFSDVTIACDDVQIEAHKIILSASSPFFKNLLKKNKHPHPLVYLKGLKNSLLVSILDFIYDGEVNIAHEDLNEFLSAAEELKVKGLSEENTGPSRLPGTEKTNSVTVPRELTSKKPFKPAIAPEKQQYPQECAISEPSIKVESHVEAAEDYSMVASHVEEEDYSMVEYDAEDLQIAHDSSMADQIESMFEKYEGVWTCKACGKTASQKCNIRSHVETHHLNDFSHHCDICGKSCRSKNALNVHKSTYHRSKPIKSPGDFHSAFPSQHHFL